MRIVKIPGAINAGEDVEKGEHLLPAGGGCESGQPLLKTGRRFLKKPQLDFPYDLANPLLGVHLKA